jgi:hypothetical protein
MPGVDRRNASAPIWHAILRYATRDLDLQGWEQPLGVSRIDVCTPSGLLPTVYCPEVVRELFLQGSEPTSFDHLYQPYRLNQETGKLATLFTPLDLIEERVYFVPPPEAADWAAQIGLEQPPQEYDSLAQLEIGSEEAQIQSPAALALESGQSYRLQYGPGLDPGRWVQIGQDQPAPVEQGLLGVWDSEGLNGLYTLQLVVVLEGGEIRSAAIPISLDNQAPDLQLESPAPNARLQAGEEVFIEMRVEDAFGVASVTVFVDQVLIARLTTGPYAVRWIPEEAGEYDLTIRARDNVGNTQALEWTWIVEE